ncbi:hypothetical protein O3P69_015501 [Scylla paramamosain]|uniref:Uncharacterized protein n=1 Tax=Scylla paramamosain TaxID=85552 RepID=A0AAW0T8N8_SCYPA
MQMGLKYWSGSGRWGWREKGTLGGKEERSSGGQGGAEEKGCALISGDVSLFIEEEHLTSALCCRGLGGASGLSVSAASSRLIVRLWGASGAKRRHLASGGEHKLVTFRPPIPAGTPTPLGRGGRVVPQTWELWAGLVLAGDMASCCAVSPAVSRLLLLDTAAYFPHPHLPYFCPQARGGGGG